MRTEAAECDAWILVPGDKGLEVPLSTGTAYFNYHWLRDADPTTIDPATRERTFDIAALDAAPRARSAQVEGDDLVVEWANEAHTSRVPLEFLRAFVETGCRPDSALQPLRLWHADAWEGFSRFRQVDIEASDAVRLAFARALIVDGIAFVDDVEDSDAGLTRLAAQLGNVTPTADGHYFDVRLEIAPTNLAFTARELELHTDLPSEEAAPGVQFLHCRANTVAGGRSLFVDGAAVAEALRLEDPSAFELLASHDIPFFRRHDGWDYRAHQRVIELDGGGRVTGLTVSQHLQDDLDLPQHLLDDYYPALCRLLRMLRQDRFVNRFRLPAGTCAVFDNHRTVHGREAFEATSGIRHLRGCYVDRGALRSTFRTLDRPDHRPDR